MKRLILMRHAKSDWSEGVSSDHDRRLNPRGRKSAAALGKWLNETQIFPDQILSSSATRTKETLARLNLTRGPEITFTRDLYLATPDQIITVLKQATGQVVLMIGHNPGIAEAAEQVLAQAPDHPDFARYPTGATLVADFEIEDWKKVSWGIAQLAYFIVPRDL